MSSDNDGGQIVTIRFHQPVDSDVVNKRFKDIRELGIYKGGRMSYAGGIVTLTELVCEISDGTYQVRVETTTDVYQSVTQGAPYVVLKWAYSGSVDTDFMTIDNVSSPAPNDIVVGEVQFPSGQVTYAERTTPDTHHLFLRVEETETPSTSVRVRAGVGHAGSAHAASIDRIFDLSEYSSGNIVYIYVKDNGGVDHSKTPSDYVGKALLAKIVYPGDGIIENSDIEDARSFVTSPVIPDESTITRSSTGELKVKSIANQFIPSAYAGEESITFPNGLIIKQGTKAALGTVTFAAPFPTACVNVQLTSNNNGNAHTNMRVSSVTKNGFYANGAYFPAYWVARGY